MRVPGWFVPVEIDGAPTAPRRRLAGDGMARAELRRLLRREIKRAARVQAHIMVLEPGEDEVLAMGLNLMDDTRGAEIRQLGLDRTQRRLADRPWLTMLGEIGGQAAPRSSCIID